MNIQTNYEKFLNFNPITRYLHRNKSKLLFSHLDGLYEQKILTDNEPCVFLDIGCGPAHIYRELSARYHNIRYIGIEPQQEFCETAESNYGHDSRFTILQGTAEEHFDELNDIDVIIAFDCFEHVPLDIRNMFLDRISCMKFKRLYINVPNEVGPAILIKNFGSWIMRYNRYMEYSVMDTINSFLYRMDRVTVHYDGHKGFDWRVLHSTLRFYFRTLLFKSPSQLIPSMFSPSIFFVCEKYKESEQYARRYRDLSGDQYH